MVWFTPWKRRRRGAITILFEWIYYRKYIQVLNWKRKSTISRTWNQEKSYRITFIWFGYNRCCLQLFLTQYYCGSMKGGLWGLWSCLEISSSYGALKKKLGHVNFLKMLHILEANRALRGISRKCAALSEWKNFK